MANFVLKFDMLNVFIPLTEDVKANSLQDVCKQSTVSLHQKPTHLVWFGVV